MYRPKLNLNEEKSTGDSGSSRPEATVPDPSSSERTGLPMDFSHKSENPSAPSLQPSPYGPTAPDMEPPSYSSVCGGDNPWLGPHLQSQPPYPTGPGIGNEAQNLMGYRVPDQAGICSEETADRVFRCDADSDVITTQPLVSVGPPKDVREQCNPASVASPPPERTENNTVEDEWCLEFCICCLECCHCIVDCLRCLGEVGCDGCDGCDGCSS